jgi:hypothetical protein
MSRIAWRVFLGRLVQDLLPEVLDLLAELLRIGNDWSTSESMRAYAR